jgi:prepilin-type N-terminal cleavage/methylation domain-containing protein
MIPLRKGFTLIELLIVIALLGALAVGLLAALDPFEQLKKGTDTGVRNTVSEVHGAVIRYYAIKNYMPWCTGAGACGTEPVGTVLTDATMTTMITNIVGSGELKSDFSTLAGAGTLGKIYVTGTDAAATVSVCYRPTAKSFLSDPNTKYNSSGVLTTCVTSDLATCFWCVK